MITKKYDNNNMIRILRYQSQIWEDINHNLDIINLVQIDTWIISKQMHMINN
jgi:hypothetical protein